MMEAQAPRRDDETALMVRRPPTPLQLKAVEDRIRRVRDEKAVFAVVDETPDEFGDRTMAFDWSIKAVGAGQVTIARPSADGESSRNAPIAEFVYWQRMWVGREKSEGASMAERLKRHKSEGAVEAGRADHEGRPIRERGWLVEGVDYATWNVLLSRDTRKMEVAADRFALTQMKAAEESANGRRLAQKMAEEGAEAVVELIPGSPGFRPTYVTGWRVAGIRKDGRVRLERTLGEALGSWNAYADDFAGWQTTHERLTGGKRLAEYEELTRPQGAFIPIADSVKEVAKTPDDELMSVTYALPEPKEHPKGLR
jgi:hypothetical protein